MKSLRTLLLATFLASGIAQAQTPYGHWVAGALDDQEGFYAATGNDSGAILGEYCTISSKRCIWYIAIDTACQKDVVSPVLGNTDQGAASLEIVCIGPYQDGLYKYAFKNWKELERLIKSGERVGLAMPMQADQFKVYRFMLDGLNDATKVVESTFFSAIGPPKKKPVKRTDTATQSL